MGVPKARRQSVHFRKDFHQSTPPSGVFGVQEQVPNSFEGGGVEFDVKLNRTQFLGFRRDRKKLEPFPAKLDLATGIKFVLHFEIFISVIFGDF